MSSSSALPIGFCSFAEESAAKPIDQSFAAGESAAEVSFAQSELAKPEQLLQEIQNRASYGIDEDSLENSKLPMTKGLLEKREMKQSAKKNELYLRILKEHGIDPKAFSDANKLNYQIPPLPMTLTGQKSKPKTPITQIFNEAMTGQEQKENPQ